MVCLDSTDIIKVLRNSKDNIVRTLYRCILTGQLYIPNQSETSPPKNQEVVTTFRHSLSDLISKLLSRSGDPFFVRCIKPNDFYKPKHFDCQKV